MKNLILKSGSYALMLGLVFLLCMTTGNQVFAASAVVSVGVMSAMHHAGVFKGAFFNTVVIPQFEEKSLEDQEKMTFQELREYRLKENEFTSKTLEKRLQDQLDAINKGREEGQDMTKEISDLEEKMNKMIAEVNAQGVRLKGITEKSFSKGDMPKTIKDSIVAREEEFKTFLSDRKGTFTLEVDISKASQSAADITSGDDFAQMLPGVGQIPYQKTYIKDRIRVVPTNTEYIKYLDQATVVRDAKNVAGCAASTHNTKLTWQTYTLQQQKIRDFIHVCIDMLEDYDFVEAEIRNLIDSSVQLKCDSDLLLGDGIAPNIAGIDSYSATFNAAAAGADYSLAVDNATIIDLIVVVGAQIAAFGSENFWMADTCYINPRDLTLLKLLKDQDQNYIKTNTVAPGVIMNRAGNIVVDGMIDLIPNPNVTANQLYIFDSRQAAIYQKKTAVIEFSYENNDNFETETVTVKAYERLNLLVRNVNANAFIHVPNITTALAAIEKP